MDKETAQALYDLQQTARLSEESDYLVRDTLGFVSDEEKEAHDERVKTESGDDSGAQKAAGATKKAS